MFHKNLLKACNKNLNLLKVVFSIKELKLGSGRLESRVQDAIPSLTVNSSLIFVSATIIEETNVWKKNLVLIFCNVNKNVQSTSIQFKYDKVVYSVYYYFIIGEKCRLYLLLEDFPSGTVMLEPYYNECFIYFYIHFYEEK